MIGYDKEQLVVGSEWKGRSGADRKVVSADHMGYIKYRRRAKDGTFPTEGPGCGTYQCYYPTFCEWATKRLNP